MANEVLKVEKLTKVFNGVLVAVDHITFSVASGEIFGFVGPNGAGKTTTISMLTTILKPTEGRAEVVGFDVVKEASKVREAIGLVPQELTVDDELTGMENLMLQARLYHIPSDIAKKRAEDILEVIGLTDAANRYVKTYSGGMRKRLELAEGLLHYPKVLFLDEPTLGLDVQTRAVMWEYIKKLSKEQNITIFLTTHYMEEADFLCDRLAIIDRGKIVALGTPRELKDQLGGDVIQIALKDDSPDIRKDLETLPFVKDVMRDGENYRIKVARGEEAMPRIFGHLSKNGVEVKTVSLIKPSLDQVFLEYTGRSLRDAEQTGEDRRKKEVTMRRLRA